MKKVIIFFIFNLILFSSISLALEPGILKINNVIIPYQVSQFEKAFSELKASFEEEEKEILYVYANGQRIAKKTENGIFYFHNDHLGSPRAITNEAGEVVERIDYLPFGEETSLTNSKIKYNSKELDKDTNLLYYGARYYNSEVGRFITADTIKGKIEDPQSLNLYSYVKNNPLKYIDPSGNVEMRISFKSYEESMDKMIKFIQNEVPGGRTIVKVMSLFGYGSGKEATETFAIQPVGATIITPMGKFISKISSAKILGEVPKKLSTQRGVQALEEIGTALKGLIKKREIEFLKKEVSKLERIGGRELAKDVIEIRKTEVIAPIFKEIDIAVESGQKVLREEYKQSIKKEIMRKLEIDTKELDKMMREAGLSD